MHPVEDTGVDAPEGVHAAAVAELGNVGAGGEAAAGADDHRDPRRPLQVRTGLVQRGHGLEADGVADVWAVQPKDHPVAMVFDEEYVAHGRSSRSAVP